MIDMSQLCGKCDFYDGFVDIDSDGDEERVKEKLKKLKLNIYGMDGRPHRVKSDTIKDIAKYWRPLSYITILLMIVLLIFSLSFFCFCPFLS